jgi:G3E family GTPase
VLSCSFNLNLNLPSHVALHFCVWYVLRLAKTNTFDYILIEASGVAEPLPIAETFTFDDEVDGLPVKDLAMVDTMVTVVDAFNFLKDFKAADTLEFRKLAGTF